MNRMPVVEGVRDYINEKNISFCMPGHKYGKGFKDTKEGRIFLDNYFYGDITEVDGVDNLHNPDGIIKEAQELLGVLYKSYKSYFLVNGSTSGNLAMIFACLNEGDKVIVERNCHRSIYNGIIMRKLNPVYIKSNISNKYQAEIYTSEDVILDTIRCNRDCKAIIITYPNYYGVCFDLEKITYEAKKYNMLVLVDSAHGAHFGFNERLPESAVRLGADIVVMSAHKTLPSLTQTAYLHLNNSKYKEQIELYISMFMSTSPSYLFLQSLDYARFYMQEYAENGYNQLIDLSEEFKLKINALKGFNILCNDDIKNEEYKRVIDETRYVINLDKGYSGHKLNRYLREKNIQVEMSDIRNVVLIFSIFNTRDEFEYLYSILKECNLEFLRGEEVELIDSYIPKKKHLPHETIQMKKTKIHLMDAIGCVCGESIVPYPPGIPVVLPGEIIDKNVVDYIQFCLNNNMDVLGIENQYIYILD